MPFTKHLVAGSTFTVIFPTFGVAWMLAWSEREHELPPFCDPTVTEDPVPPLPVTVNIPRQMPLLPPKTPGPTPE